MKNILKKIFYICMCYVISLVITLIGKLFGFVEENIFIYALILMIMEFIIDIAKKLIKRK